MSPADCCTHHSRVSDLWPWQPAGLSVFSYALCLLFFYPLYLRERRSLEKYQSLKNSWQTLNCADDEWQAVFSLVYGDIWVSVWMDGLSKKATTVYASVEQFKDKTCETWEAYLICWIPYFISVLNIQIHLLPQTVHSNNNIFILTVVLVMM